MPNNNLTLRTVQEVSAIIPNSRTVIQNSNDFKTENITTSILIISIDEIPKFTVEQIKAFTPEQIPWFTEEQIPYFTKEQIPWFTEEQIKAFTPEQIPKFTVEQIKAFTPNQRIAFGKNIKFFGTKLMNYMSMVKTDRLLVKNEHFTKKENKNNKSKLWNILITTISFFSTISIISSLFYIFKKNNNQIKKNNLRENKNDEDVTLLNEIICNKKLDHIDFDEKDKAKINSEASTSKGQSSTNKSQKM